MPCKPKKCCGKKVIFTPMNIIKKWAVALVWSKWAPVNRLNQWLKPANIAKTAPIDST